MFDETLLKSNGLQTPEEKWFPRPLFKHTQHMSVEMLLCSHSGGVWAFTELVSKQFSHD